MFHEGWLSADTDAWHWGKLPSRDFYRSIAGGVIGKSRVVFGREVRSQEPTRPCVASQAFLCTEESVSGV